MFKIWAKILKDGKIIKQAVYQSEEKFAYSKFFNYLADICEELDIAAENAYIQLRKVFNREVYSARLCRNR